MADEKPIFSFDGLKKLLTSMGYQVEKATGYREVANVDVDLNELKNNMEFSNDGIFLIDPNDGSKQQIFLYKRNYHLTAYGKPRFHIRCCQTIQSFMNSGSFKKEYRRANSNSVLVCDMDDGFSDKQIENLPLCSYCAKMASEAFSGMDSEDFVAILKEANEASAEDTFENQEVDIFGYVRNWDEISRAYRETHDYTCEKCGISIQDPFDRQYIQVHHKNGDKLNNKTSNLQCLCIRCHANVDDVHRHNFSSRANKLMIDKFNKKYPPIIEEDPLPF